MLRNETSIVIDRSIEEVWAFMLDPFNLPRASKSWLGARKITPGPLGLGSTVHGRWAIFGVEMRGRLEVTEWVPPHRVTLSGSAGWLRSIALGGRLESAANGTRMVRISTFDPHPAVRPVFWLLWPFIRGWQGKNDRNFKRLIEAGRSSGATDAAH